MVFWAKNLEKIAEKERRKAEKKATKEKIQLKKKIAAHKVLFFNNTEKEIDKKITDNCIQILESKRFVISKNELYLSFRENVKYDGTDILKTGYNEVFEDIKNHYRKAGWIIDENQDGFLIFKRK